MNKLVFLCLSLLCFNTSCQTQTTTESKILEFSKIENIIDSIPSPRAVEEINGEKKWKEKFKYNDNVEVYKISYLSDGLKINGFVVQPKNPGKYPCVIYNRGGNRDFGAIGMRKCAGILAKIANEGYVVIGSNYREGGGSEGRDEFCGADINDVLNLFPLLGEIEKADTKRIGMFGGSRGGIMTYKALTLTDQIKAAAVLGAPADKSIGFKERPSMEEMISEMVPGYKENREAEMTKRSAVKWADKFPKDVPLLIMHGNSDWRVKSIESIMLAAELDKHRVPYRLLIFEGGDHSVSEYRDEFYVNLFAWFDKYLKKDTPLPNMEFHGR